jgi:hypothetical protein
MPDRIAQTHKSAHNARGDMPEVTGEDQRCSCWICGGTEFKSIGRAPNGMLLEVCEECNW